MLWTVRRMIMADDFSFLVGLNCRVCSEKETFLNFVPSSMQVWGRPRDEKVSAPESATSNFGSVISSADPQN